VTPIAVLMPWSLRLVKQPMAFLLEPGLPPVPGRQPDPTHLLLANPGGPGTYTYWFTGGLLLAGLAGLLRTGPRRRITFAGWMLALAGFAAGLLALQVHPTGLAGGLPQQPWSGVPTAAIGFGLIVAAVIGAEGAREYFRVSHLSWRQPTALLVALAAVTTPVAAAAWWATHGVAGPVQRSAADFRPAVVSVQAQMPDQPRALILGSGAQTAIGYGVVRGAGASLGDADYLVPTADADRISGLVGGLLSDSGGTELQGLADMGIRYVVGMKTLAPDYARILDSTPGLDRQSQIEGVSLWKIATPAARLSLRGPGSGDPKALQVLSADDRSMKATLAAGGDGRTLLLAEDVDSHWSAKLGGTELKPTTVDGWEQGFELPAGGSGTLTVSYSNVSRTAWLLVEGLFFLFALVMALPTGGRAEESGPESEDEYVPLTAAVPAQGAPGLDADDLYDEADAEMAGEDEFADPDPVPAHVQATEYSGYQDEYGRYGSGEYERPAEYSPYQDQPYQDPTYQHQPYQDQPYRDQSYRDQSYQDQSYQDQSYQDQYEQQANPYGQPDPYAQQQGQHPAAEPEDYGGYLRPGSGEHERPDFDTDDYRQGGYR
jgi:hypothetical protein